MLVFEQGADPNPASRTVAVVATGDLRAAAKRRLVEAGGARTDLSPVTDRVLACVCASAFEADAAWLEIARERLPGTYRAALDRWRAWFLHLDPDSDLPVWSRTDLSEHADGSVPAGFLLGPIGTKDQSKRLGQWLDEMFELCREPKLLAQRPDAVACSYKQMGACPAPCDGSEPMETYRDRVREAAAIVADGPATAIESLEDKMRAAAASMDFETAGELRVRGERYAELRKPNWSRATSLDRFAVIAVQPAGRKGWARVM
ncbi:MAG: UvrB/UvrC motif-containing protein, partial [Planctomycetota bacterium]